MLTAIIFIMGFIFLVLLAVTVFWPQINEMMLRKQGKVIRVLLYEAIGQQKIYRGEHKAIEKYDEALGVYLKIGKVQKVISTVSPKDYFGDAKYGKSLMVCKYADDDYRVIARLTDDGWLKKVPLPVDQYMQTELIEDEETGEKIVTIKKDKDGNELPILDEDGLPLPDHDYVSYDEPLGVDQPHREVMRFNRVFSKRMQEKRKQVPGFWEKYAPYITTVVVVFIMFISFAYMTNKYTASMEATWGVWDENTKEYIQATNNPTFAQNLIESIEEKNKEAEAPPK